MGYLMYYSN